MILPGKKVLGDLGYKGDRKVITRLDKKNSQHEYAMGCARDCHETLNARLKTWGSLKNNFRHNRHHHQFFFQSVTVIEQMKIENESKPFQIINYIDPVCI